VEVDIDWINLAQNGYQWLASVKMMILWVA
jgi:hypothetical protein